MRYRNSDADIRASERAVRGDQDDLSEYVKLLRKKLRAGLLSHDRIVMAARLGHAAAREAAPEWAELGPVWLDTYYSRHNAINALGDKLEIVAFACDCAERVLPIFERNVPGDMRPRLAIEAARAWIISPSNKTADAAFVAFVASSDARDTAIAREASCAAGAAAYAALVARDAADAAYAALAAAEATAAAALSVTSSLSGLATEACRLAWVAMSISESELTWQKLRLAKYLLGEVILPPLT